MITSIVITMLLDQKVVPIEDTAGFLRYRPFFKKSARIAGNQYLVGFDLEFVCRANLPITLSETSWYRKDYLGASVPCLLQLCSKDYTLLIDLTRFKSLPTALIKMISTSGVIKCGLGVQNDIKIIQEYYQLKSSTLSADGVFDLLPIAKYKLPDSPGLVSFYNSVFGTTFKKKTISINSWIYPLQS